MLKPYCIECTDSVSGKVGTFTYKIGENYERIATSPVFDDCAAFFDYVHSQPGWIVEQWGGFNISTPD